MKLHRCIESTEIDLESDTYGSAINMCYEKAKGTLWVTNGEYSSQVNFCPYCGYRAKIAVK